MATNYRTGRSSATNWFLHRITGTFLIFLLITHFWIQHYDKQTATVLPQAISNEATEEQGALPDYAEYHPESVEAVNAFRAARGLEPVAEVTPYDVVMLRLADPVYAVLWKGFNIFFLIFALHHGFYGLNNVLGDYIRNDLARLTVRVLTWTLALVLLVIGLYSVITAGWALG